MTPGYQLYSSRNFGPIVETLKMLASLGYAEVEGYGGLFQTLEDRSALARALQATGLSMPSGHVDLDMVEDRPDAVIDIARTLGLSHVFVPYLAADGRPSDADAWRAFGARLERAGAPLVDAGLVFGWHNHDFEFTLLDDGTMPIEALFAGGPSLAFEFDVAWCLRAGADPLPWIEALADRIAAVHVKDIAPPGENADEDGWADVGDGWVDWSALVPKLQKAGCGLFIVEHDNPGDDKRFARRSLAALSAL